MNKQIVLIGAGSAQFGYGTIGDIFQSDVLAGSHIVLQKASWTATQEMNSLLKRPYKINVPMLVLGGEFDGTVLPDAICETAVAYNAPCHVFKNMGHNLMLEPAWHEVAAYIQNWLHQTNSVENR